MNDVLALMLPTSDNKPSSGRRFRKLITYVNKLIFIASYISGLNKYTFDCLFGILQLLIII